MNRLINVFQALRAHLNKLDVDLAAHLMVRIVRHADATRLGQDLQAGSDVYPVTEYVVTLGDDVAEVDANTKSDASVIGYLSRAVSHRRLNFDRAAHRIHHARELQQQAVAGGL